jgi:hypothetical protein
MKRATAMTLFLLGGIPLAAAQNADEVAKQLSNPIASLTSVPMQFNFEHGAGASGGAQRSRLNIQPVVPLDLGGEWNLISRTIAPVIDQDEMIPGAGPQSGVGDVLQSLFFSPDALTAGGWTWGAGPVLLLPTAQSGSLGGGEWGAGPTAVALKQTPSGWTFGGLANHVWSIAGDSERRDVNATFLQPFASKRVGPGRTVSANLESTYDWEGGAWTIPLNVGVSQILPIGGQLVSLQAGAAWCVEAPHGVPDWGLRFTLTLLFPKR